MSSPRISLACALALTLAACGQGGQGGESAPPPAATGSAAPQDAPAAAPAAQAAAEAPATSPELAALIAAADLKKGKVLFLQCRACHSIVPEAEPGKIGPTLYGVVGRKAGTAAGYAYSDAVANSGITWSADQIDKWLQRPSEFLPGNKMVFVGIQEPQDRANIIAFIQEESAKPAP